MARRGFLSRIVDSVRNIFSPAPEPEPIEESEPTGPYEPEEPEYYPPEDIDDEPFGYPPEEPGYGGGIAPITPYPTVDPDYFLDHFYDESGAGRSEAEEFSFLAGEFDIADDDYALELLWFGWFDMSRGTGVDRDLFYDYTGIDRDDFDWFDWREWYGVS